MTPRTPEEKAALLKAKREGHGPSVPAAKPVPFKRQDMPKDAFGDKLRARRAAK